MRKLKLDELNRPSLDNYKASDKIPVVVILDNVRSAMNVGSFFRTCDAFNVSALYLVGIAATPPNKEITKTAIGATESVTWHYFESITLALAHVKEEGFTCIGIEQTDKSMLLNEFEIEQHTKYALVFGNEVDGVSEEALPMLDLCLEIPQMGIKHSLNVSVCGGVVLWDFYKVHL